MPKDYVRYRLCGDIATDPSDASGTLLYNSHHCRWSSEVIKALKLPAHFLPLVRLSHSIAGYLDEIMAEHMGLCAGITVVTGAADVSCEALAAEVSEPGRGFIRLGTAGVVCATVNERILPTGGAACYNHALHGQWLIVTGTQACGSSLLWARNLFVDNAEKGFEQLTDLAAHAPPGSEGLLFLPHLSGERAPYWNANLTGQFIGIQLKHDRRHFARAVLEGVAYSLRDSLSDVPELDGCIQTYTLLGGASSNPLLCQILADVFSAPMFVRPWAEPALGAAILAGMGSGWLSDRPLSLAGNALVSTPDADRNAVYEAAFLRYRALHHPPNVIFM
jgi:xylulokinase